MGIFSQGAEQSIHETLEEEGSGPSDVRVTYLRDPEQLFASRGGSLSPRGGRWEGDACQRALSLFPYVLTSAD